MGNFEKAESSFLHGNNIHDYSERWALQRADLEMLERQYAAVVDSSNRSVAAVATTIEVRPPSPASLSRCRLLMTPVSVVCPT